MKRWFGIVIGLLIIALAAFYLFVPGTIHISSIKTVNSSMQTGLRYLSNDSNWAKWWPGETEAGGFTFHGNQYSLKRKMFQSFEVEVKHGEERMLTSIVLLPLRRDSFEVEWKATFTSGWSPTLRLAGYNQSRSLEDDLHNLLSAFGKYVSDTKNTYGQHIEETQVKDSIILVSAMTISHYPTPDELYARIAKMKKYVEEKNATETNFPMLNVDSVKGNYYVRIGIPVDREIDVAGSGYTIKRMVLGKILVSDITGGPYTVEHAIDKMEDYMADFGRRSPAIPYESLVTNRAEQRDTLQWKTRVYYPVY